MDRAPASPIHATGGVALDLKSMWIPCCGSRTMTLQEQDAMVMDTVACQVVIPAVSERTRLPWTPDKTPNWEYATSYLFGGISPVAVGVVGLWRDPRLAPARGVIPDPQNRYEIAVPVDCVDELREYMKFTCAYFDQQCLYFRVGATVEFVANPLGWPADSSA